MCKFCDKPFAWGQLPDGKWKPLVPVGEDDGLDRAFQDGSGMLRADHALVCVGRVPSVQIERLAVPVAAESVLPSGPPKTETVGETVDRIRKEKAQKRANKRFERDMTSTDGLPS
jgi:hypothetical protein